MTCKKCKYWERDNLYGKPREEPHNHFGKCSSEKFIYTGRDRNSLYETQVPYDGFNYWDVDEYFADFLTGEDFGCIHFKDRC